MLALASQAVKDKPKLRSVLLALGIFGTSLFYGDGVITPAISVLSAVEGLEIVSHHFTEYVIPITLVVLLCLFMVQKRGTGGIDDDEIIAGAMHFGKFELHAVLAGCGV